MYGPTCTEIFHFDVRTASSVNVQTLVDTTMHHCKDISSPSQKFRLLNVDIAGSLPNSNGYTYILVLVDRLSRWPVAVPMKGSRTQTIIYAFIVDSRNSTWNYAPALFIQTRLEHIPI